MMIVLVQILLMIAVFVQVVYQIMRLTVIKIVMVNVMEQLTMMIVIYVQMEAQVL